MATRSKNKGDGYERELAAYIDKAIFGGSGRVFRAPLSGGGRSLHGGGSADLTGTPDLWVEAKRTEKFTPHAALAQAERGIAANKFTKDIPVVINRRNRMKTGESLTLLRLDDFLKIYLVYLQSLGHDVGEAEDLQCVRQEQTLL